MARVTKAQLQAENSRLTKFVGRLLSDREQVRTKAVKVRELRAQQNLLITEIVHHSEKADVPKV